MTSRRVSAEDEVCSILCHDSDIDERQESDSEIEDNVQSDFEDEYIDDEAIEESNIIPNEDLSQPTGSSERDNRISIPAGRVNRGRTSATNIICTNRGPTRMCQNIVDPLLCFNLFITDEIVEEIVRWTNVEMPLKRGASMTSSTFKDTTSTELRALIGILTLSAVKKDNHLSTDELFDSTFSGTRYVAAMSRERFDFLSRCLRMDDKSLRPQQDPFIPVRKVWDLFITQCKLNYSPGEHVTIEEQLLEFRGRCPFKVYIPNKPNKYGIKIIMMCDIATKYMLNAMIHIGKATNTNGLPLEEYYLKELSRSIHGANRINLSRNHIGTSMFCYDCSRKTNRWPMTMFYGILNIAFINSYVIYCHNVLTQREKPLSRREFMKKLSAQLTAPWMMKRLEAPSLPKHVRNNIESILPKSAVQASTDDEEEPSVKKRRYCSFCKSKKKRMSKMTCGKCKKTVCGEHKEDICYECI